MNTSISNGLPTKEYVNLTFTKDQWCSYKGICRINNLLIANNVCNCCKYKVGIDIPKIIDAALEKENNEDN